MFRRLFIPTRRVTTANSLSWRIGAVSASNRALPQDEPLVVGDEAIFGGVKIIPATGVMILPDGSKDICSEWSCYGSAGWMYAGMTARHGWD